MENKEEKIVDENDFKQSDASQGASIVIDIEQGTSYDMDKDFKQVGKSTIYYIVLQFIIAFIIVFIAMTTMLPTIIEGLNLSDVSSLGSESELMMAKLADSMMVWITVVSGFSALVSGWLVVRSAKKKLNIDKEELRRKNPLDITMIIKYSIIAMGLSGITSYVVLGLNMILNVFGLQFSTPDFSLSSDITANIFMLISMLLVAPIFEELLCRGVILRTLQRYNTRFAIIVSAIIFGLLHMNFIQGLPAFAMGLVFAYVSVKANSVIPSIIMHLFNNAFAVMASAIIGMASFVEIGFLVIEVLMMLFAVYYIVSHRTQFTQDEDLIVSAKGYYSRFFSCWPNVVLITICSIFTILSIVIL